MSNLEGTLVTCSSCSKPFIKGKRGMQCKDCILMKQRNRRRLSGDIVTKRYEKTKKGFLMRAYRNMKSRVEGVQKRSMRSYLGLEILNKEDFYKWSLGNEDFHNIFQEWVSSGYVAKYSPSVDRIDPREGYYVLNMQWVTLSENSKRAAAFRYRGRII